MSALDLAALRALYNAGSLDDLATPSDVMNAIDARTRLRDALDRDTVAALLAAAERAEHCGAERMRTAALAAIDDARESVRDEAGGYDGDRVDDGMCSARHFVEALDVDAVLLDHRELAERAPVVSRDASEVVDAVLRAFGYTDGIAGRFDADVAEATAIVQRAIDAEGCGAERTRLAAKAACDHDDDFARIDAMISRRFGGAS